MTEDEHKLCELENKLTEVRGELRATAKALELARDNRHFMWMLMLNFIISMLGVAVGLIALLVRG